MEVFFPFFFWSSIRFVPMLCLCGTQFVEKVERDGRDER